MNSRSKQSETKTIVALSTPRGKGAIAIIRLSGPQALGIAEQLWRGKQPLEHLEPHRLYGGWVVIKGKKLDQTLIATSHGPRSYTGEDMVELHTHGSPAVIDTVLNACLELGAQLAAPGEFTQRALLSGKLDAAQAEAVADLVEAESVQLARLAADQLAGGLSRTMSVLVEKIVTIAAGEAAYLDFSEEDIASENDDKLGLDIQGCISELEAMLAYSRNIPLLRNGIKVALVGLPNAGKSTLLNSLVGFERSIVTDIAGTTRDTIDERIMLGDVPVRLVDTAGLNADPDSVEAIGIERTHREARQSDIVLVLVAPGNLTITEEYIKNNKLEGIFKNKHTLLVHTKSDLGEVKDSTPKWARQVYTISAKTGQGMEEFKIALADHVSVGGSEEAVALTTQRQVELARAAAKRLKEAQKLLAHQAPRDIILVELEAAAKELTRITGADTNDAMIADMFSRFCIGK